MEEFQDKQWKNSGGNQWRKFRDNLRENLWGIHGKILEECHVGIPGEILGEISGRILGEISDYLCSYSKYFEEIRWTRVPKRQNNSRLNFSVRYQRAFSLESTASGTNTHKIKQLSTHFPFSVGSSLATIFPWLVYYLDLASRSRRHSAFVRLGHLNLPLSL